MISSNRMQTIISYSQAQLQSNHAFLHSCILAEHYYIINI